MEDRWWTGRPVRRRYFELVLAGGRNAVVFRELTGRGVVRAAGVTRDDRPRPAQGVGGLHDSTAAGSLSAASPPRRGGSRAPW